MTVNMRSATRRSERARLGGAIVSRVIVSRTGRHPEMLTLRPRAKAVVLVLRWLVAAHLGLLGRSHGLSVLLLALREVIKPGML